MQYLGPRPPVQTLGRVVPFGYPTVDVARQHSCVKLLEHGVSTAALLLLPAPLGDVSVHHYDPRRAATSEQGRAHAEPPLLSWGVAPILHHEVVTIPSR